MFYFFSHLPITDGDQEVFGRGGEELKVGDVQLLHLDGLAELDDEPGWKKQSSRKTRSQVARVDGKPGAAAHATYQILLLQGFSMYRSMFSFSMAAVLCAEQSH